MAPRSFVACALQVFSILLVASKLTPGVSADGGAWSEIFQLDCGGKVNFMNNHLLAAHGDVKDVIDMAQFISDRLFARAKAVCPALELTEFVRDFVPSPSMLVNTIAGEDSKNKVSSCSSSTFTYKFADFFAEIFQHGFMLPSTCTLDTLAAGKGCLMKFPLSNEKDSFVNVAMDTCDASMMKPYMSVTCSGPLCSRLAMPCNANADCGGSLQCANPGILSENHIKEADKDVRSVMQELDMFDKNVDRPQCLKAGTAANEDGADIIGSFMTFFRSFYDGKQWDSMKGEAKFAVCGGNLIDPDFIEKNFVDPVGCEATGSSKVICNGLQSWDGVLADGSNVFASSRKQGVDANHAKCASQTGTLRGMMDITCWGKVGFSFGKRMTAYLSMKHLPKLLEWYSTTNKKVQDCRGNGAAYTLPYYLANFAPWMPNAVMQRLTTGTQTGERNVVADEKVGVSKPMLSMMNDMTDAVGGALVMPTKCSFATWLSTGTCVMEYTGLSALIGSQLTLRLRMETCPSNKHATRIQVDCEGPVCNLISPATRCEKDTDCSGLGKNFECTDFSKDLESADPIGGLLWPRKKEVYRWGRFGPLVPCSEGTTSECKNSADVSFFDCDSQHCNPGLFKSEMGHALTAYQNGQPYEENTSVKFCTPHLDNIADELETWSKNQYSVVGDAYTISGMRDADVAKIEFCESDRNNAATPPATTATVTGTITLDGYTAATFGTAEKTAFKSGLAKTANVEPASITIVVKDTRRHLLAGVSIEFTIATTDAATATTISNAIKSTPTNTMVANMKAAGLTKVTTITTVLSGENPAVVDSSPTPPYVTVEEESAAPSSTVRYFFALLATALALFSTMV